MRVLKRNGRYEDVSFDKILSRIRALSQGSEFDRTLSIDDTLVAQKVVQEIYDGVKTSELDELSSPKLRSRCIPKTPILKSWPVVL